MSGIAAIYNLDGRPAEASLLRRMTAAVAHRGPDGVNHWVDGAVAIGHCMLHTTPESLLEQQPLTDESGKLCLTFDGRVDNRAELRRALESKGARLRDNTDAELVLRAYECWQEDCPKEILGDFAFAIWDGRKRQLFCARDIMGIKPLYYYSNARTVLITSELRQILADPEVPRQPNEGMVAEYLASSINLEETLYRGVFRLPRAHSIIFNGDRMQKCCYWTLDGSREISHQSDHEYAAQFLEIFAGAVRCRLRSIGPVGAELSGGLDSSAVVSTAKWLMDSGVAKNLGLETFSLVFPGLDCDESSFIDPVVRKWGLSSNCIPDSLPDVSAFTEQIRMHGEFPDSPTTQMNNPFMELARRKRIRVLMGGDGGDLWLMGSPYHCADLIRRLKFIEAWGQSKSDSQASSGFGTVHSPAWMFFRFGVWPQLPQIVRREVRRVVKGGDEGIPGWIASDFVRRTGLVERIRSHQDSADSYRTIAQRESLLPGLNFPWYCAHSRYTSDYGIEYRSPFLDRRVIEFCVALPEKQRRRDGQTKFVLRQALMDLLPIEVRNRRTKARFDHTFARTLKALGGERFFQSMQIEAMGWVDGQQVRQMYELMSARFERNDPDYRRLAWPLWMICGTELWFRTIFADNYVPSGICNRTGGSINTKEEDSWTKAEIIPVSQTLHRS